MFLVCFFLFLGILTGFFIKKRKKIVKDADKATMWSVYLLLFLFGVETGLNDQVTSSFFSTGLKGILLGSGAVLGSVLCVMPIAFYMIKKDISGSDSNRNGEIEP